MSENDFVKFQGFQSSPDIIICGAGPGPLVTIHGDGSLTYGEKYKPDEAAKIFWEALGEGRNCNCKKGLEAK